MTPYLRTAKPISNDFGVVGKLVNSTSFFVYTTPSQNCVVLEIEQFFSFLGHFWGPKKHYFRSNSYGWFECTTFLLLLFTPISYLQLEPSIAGQRGFL